MLYNLHVPLLSNFVLAIPPLTVPYSLLTLVDVKTNPRHICISFLWLS